MSYLVFGLLLIVATVCAREICKPDETELDDNKICVCSSGGDHWNCEVRHNPRNRRSEDDHCEPGEAFEYYCNICVCQENALKSRAACTNAICDHAHWHENGTRITIDQENLKINDNEVPKFRQIENTKHCEPGTWFKKYCDLCVCVANGEDSRAVCTKKICDPEIWNRDGTEKEIDQPYRYSLVGYYASGSHCLPGREFKKYCNTCLCGSDGQVERAVCTMNYCDRGLWSRDGTPKAEIEFVPVAREPKDLETADL